MIKVEWFNIKSKAKVKLESTIHTQGNNLSTTRGNLVNLQNHNDNWIEAECIHKST